MNQPKVGIWRSLGDFKLRSLIWPEGLFALLIGVGGAIWVICNSLQKDRASAVGDMLGLSGALIAVIFTALVLVVSLPTGSYLRMLGESKGGMKQFLDPFLAAVGTQVAVIVLALAYRLGAPAAPSTVEHIGFCLIAFLFVFGVLDLASLARQLVIHGIARAEDAEINELEKRSEDQVRRIDNRRR